MAKISVDVSTLPGWAILAAKTYDITVVAKADGYRDSEPSAVVSVTKAAVSTTPARCVPLSKSI